MQNRQQVLKQKNEYLTESQVLQRLHMSAIYYCRYQALSEEWKKKFMDFCTGKKTLPLTYDPFFKRIFHPDIHPHRLSALLSSLIDHKVKVLKILPTEEVLLDGSALLIMDILVEVINHHFKWWFDFSPIRAMLLLAYKAGVASTVTG